jgi:hypothetical protein
MQQFVEQLSQRMYMVLNMKNHLHQQQLGIAFDLAKKNLFFREK